MDIVLERMLSLIPRKPDGKYLHGEKKKFCETIGAPTNIVSEWESGKTKSYRNYIYEVAVEYGVAVEWLKGETDEKKPTPEGEPFSTEQERLLIELFRKIPEEQQPLVLNMIRAALNK